MGRGSGVRGVKWVAEALGYWGWEHKRLCIKALPSSLQLQTYIELTCTQNSGLPTTTGYMGQKVDSIPNFTLIGAGVGA